MKHSARLRQCGAWVAILAGAAATTSWVHAQPAPAAPTPATAASSAPVSPQPPDPPDAANAGQVTARIESALAPRPGGLRVEDFAHRAETTSPEVRAKQQSVAAAAARVDQAALLFIPKLQLLARYVRLSPLPAANFGSGGYLVGTQNQGPVPVICPPEGTSTAGQPVQCFAAAAGVQVSFPVLLNMYTLQGSIGIPLSDYVLRLSQNHAAASRSFDAAGIQERATRLKVQNDARTAYYNWIRAQGGLIVAEQGLATVRAHLKDVGAAVTVGSASKADLMRVESQQASLELLVENTRNMAQLAEEQIRTMLHEPDETKYEIGEDIFAQLPEFGQAPMATLYAEALRQRLEPQVLDTTVQALRQTRKVIAAGNYPRLDAFANLYEQNPNTRRFPQEQKWSTTWDLGVQLSWTINDTLAAGSQESELDAKIMELEAQRAQLSDGIRLQVTQAYNALRSAEFARATTDRQLASSEESYRVRRELFRAGRATSAELTDAETDLLKSRFEALNARIDQRSARANLEYLLGRTAPFATR